jgi:hypothetical protein
MAGRLVTADLEQQFTQLVRAVTALGVDTDEWQLLPGEEGGEVEGRMPWVIDDGKAHAVLHLGYTRREAMTSLSTATATAQIIARQ